MIIAFSLVLSQEVKKLPLDKNLEMPISGEYRNKEFLSKVNLLFCIDPSNTLRGQYQMMVINMTYGYVLVGNRTGEYPRYGIQCDQTTSCLEDSTINKCSYNKLFYDCVFGRTLLRFKEVSLPSNFSSPGLPIRLLRPIDDWISEYGNIGILGMSKYSPIWFYLMTQYKTSDNNTISVSLSYRVKDFSKIFNESEVELVDSFFTVNGRYSGNRLISASYDNGTFNNWVYPNVDVSFPTNITYASQAVCIDNNVNFYFLIDDVLYLDIMVMYNRLLCKRDTGCNYSNSNMANVGVVRMNIKDGNGNNITVMLPPDELVLFDAAGIPTYGFGKLSQSECYKDRGINFAFGRWMLTKVELTIRVSADMKFEIGFSHLYNTSKSTSILILIFVFITICFIISAVTILLINCIPSYLNRRKLAKEKENEAYVALK